MKKYPFEPDYAVKPSETILDCIEERGISLEKLKELLDWPTLDAVIEADEQIGEELAGRLERVLGASRGFWLRREEGYRADLKRLGLDK